ncbi:MAG: MBL fold metallo-hydrolase [Verrucomicrobiales bacterium]|nr:MBL fold metallo-hydrolase [Verrucomicrobiales bacterium]
MNIPIEDFFEDIIAKTMRGRRVTEAELAEKTGVASDVLSRLCRGEFCDEDALRKVAKELDLDAEALTVSASKSWYPRSVSVDGVEIFNTPYRDMRVNAFLIWDPETKTAACFDTGTDSQPMLEEANSRGLTIEAIFLTHTHNDHIADLQRLEAGIEGEVKKFSNAEEPWPGTKTFEEGAEFSIGNLKVETRTTSGHSVGGTTYVISGLAQPVAVVGDAMFAGSMGGGMISFEDAWENNREKILTLPDETVLCPGHGPMTTVGEEKRHNPFFATEFK